MLYLDSKAMENIITRPPVFNFIFQIKLIICNSPWMTYDRLFAWLLLCTYHKSRSNFFLNTLQRYYKLVLVVRAYLANPIKKHNINLQKTLFFIFALKNKHHHSFLSWVIAKKLHTYFESFRHASSIWWNIIVLICICIFLKTAVENSH